MFTNSFRWATYRYLPIFEKNLLPVIAQSCPNQVPKMNPANAPKLGAPPGVHHILSLTLYNVFVMLVCRAYLLRLVSDEMEGGEQV